MQLSLEQLQAYLRHELQLEIIAQDRLKELLQAARDLQFMQALPVGSLSKTLPYLSLSKAQLRQDLLVLHLLNHQREGFFVEFGATNGLDWSNTHLLECHFGWTGILAEPAHVWHSDLQKNRRCIVDTDCVWHRSGETLLFNETPEAYLSTIDTFSNKDKHKNLRTKGRKYSVQTISLFDLLKRHDAPQHIDYLSIDTEGSEYEILRTFDFSAYHFSIITVEHNFTSDRENIQQLLQSKGYIRIMKEVSRFDDWYISTALHAQQSWATNSPPAAQ